MNRSRSASRGGKRGSGGRGRGRPTSQAGSKRMGQPPQHTQHSYGMSYGTGVTPPCNVQPGYGAVGPAHAAHGPAGPAYGPVRPAHGAYGPVRPAHAAHGPEGPAHARGRQNQNDDMVQISLTRAQFEKLGMSRNSASKGVKSEEQSNSRSVYYYHLKGDVEIPEICTFSIANSCKFDKIGCKRLHAKCPLQWQFCKGGRWYNFREFHSKELEEAFQKPENDGVCLTAIDPDKLRYDTSLAELEKLLGTGTWDADFDAMKMDSGGKTLTIRRLSTQSSMVLSGKMATVYEWYFKDEHDKWIKYGQPNTDNKVDCIPNVTSDELEVQFAKENQKSLEFQSVRHNYVMDFEKMTQTNEGTGVSRPVRRRTKIRPIKGTRDTEKAADKARKDSSLPSYWAPINSKLIVEQFKLNASSPEYRNIAALMMKKLPNIMIIDLKRVQNSYLWNAYSNKKRYIQAKNGTSDVQEMYLFHGTDSSNVYYICEQNLDWRLHGSNVGQMYGRGTYFSNSAKFADKYSRPARDSSKTMLIVKVVVGSTTLGNSIMSRPPINSATGSLFDTTVDCVAKPKIFVKYDSQEYYPEYVVQYR